MLYKENKRFFFKIKKEDAFDVIKHALLFQTDFKTAIKECGFSFDIKNQYISDEYILEKIIYKAKSKNYKNQNEKEEHQKDLHIFKAKLIKANLSLKSSKRLLEAFKKLKNQ